MEFKLIIKTASVSSLSALIAAIASATEETEGTVEAVVTEPGATAAAEAPKKRGRPAKVAEAEKTPEPAPAAKEPDPFAEDDDDAEEETAVTLAMIRTKGQEVLGKIKMDGLTAIVKEHGGGAETFSKLDAKYYPAVWAALNKV